MSRKKNFKRAHAMAMFFIPSFQVASLQVAAFQI
jgi:hypothetical protein